MDQSMARFCLITLGILPPKNKAFKISLYLVRLSIKFKNLPYPFAQVNKQTIIITLR